MRDNNDQIYCDVWPVAVTDCTFHLKCRSYTTKCTGKWRRKQQLLQEVKKFPAQHCVESFHHRAWTKTKIWHKSAHNTDNHVVETVCRYGYCHKFNVLSNGITKKNTLSVVVTWSDLIYLKNIYYFDVSSCLLASTEHNRKKWYRVALSNLKIVYNKCMEITWTRHQAITPSMDATLKHQFHVRKNVLSNWIITILYWVLQIFYGKYQVHLCI